MNLKKIHLELNVEDIQQLLAIALDEDPERALAFIQHKLIKRVEKALQRH